MLFIVLNNIKTNSQKLTFLVHMCDEVENQSKVITRPYHSFCQSRGKSHPPLLQNCRTVWDNTTYSNGKSLLFDTSISKTSKEIKLGGYI